MIPVACKQIEVYLFRRRGRRVEFLLLRRSAERTLALVWQPVTGGIEKGEPAYVAAAREVREETSLTPIRWWALQRLTAFYQPSSDAIHVVPVFVAEVAWTDPVHLSHEHDRYAFVSAATAAKRVLWETQREALKAVQSEILRGGASGAGAAARDVTARIAAAAKPAKPAQVSKRARTAATTGAERRRRAHPPKPLNGRRA
ncbi:MAG: NUDIX domain-containing protein [Candidatus Eisenbacteria bacterium]|uniref:NUDIX domain-containing protein n=1 Tax=Eiseniibacteriota bacterium TaxID=2212470 RepID=A0A933W8D7_UNCEI|nr:NUDIX domain-containing protein [Candidatus Eisenbacteria bacterium]